MNISETLTTKHSQMSSILDQLRLFTMESPVLERQKYLCLIMGKCFGHSSAFFLECFFSSLASNNDNHNILHEFNKIGLLDKIGLFTMATNPFPIDLLWGKCCGHFSAFIFNWIFFIFERQKYLCLIMGKCFGHSSAFIFE